MHDRIDADVHIGTMHHERRNQSLIVDRWISGVMIIAH